MEKKECPCNGPYTCKLHGGKFTYCTGTNCNCHFTVEVNGGGSSTGATTDASDEGWVGSLDAVIRDNLIWYKDNGSDHGDLVLAEEAIITKVRSKIAQAVEQERTRIREVVEGLKEKINKDDPFLSLTDQYHQNGWNFALDTVLNAISKE